MGRAIDEYKIELKNKKEIRTEAEDGMLNYLSKRGSKMLLIYTISMSMESILGKKVLDSWKLKFNDSSDFSKLVLYWKEIIGIVLPFHISLETALVGGLKSSVAAKQSSEQIRATVTSVRAALSSVLDSFAKKVNTIMLK